MRHSIRHGAGVAAPAFALILAFALTLALALFLAPMAARAWSPEGHRVIAAIADQNLQQNYPAVRDKVLAILATDTNNRLSKNDIANEANFVDVLRDRSTEAREATTRWHATRLKADAPDLSAACFNRRPLPEGFPASRGPDDACSLDKVMQFIEELKSPDTPEGERLAALQFTLNLVGDLHDPLLAIDRKDYGGDCTALQLGSKPPVRLSAMWENDFVNAAAGAAQYTPVSPDDAKNWAAGKPESWARETYEVARTVTYSFVTTPTLEKANFPPRKPMPLDPCRSPDLYRVGADYETKGQAAVKQQLVKAGLRLAAVLRDSLP